MAATPHSLDAVLKAAEFLLGARQDQMLTIEEWIGLTRAVAAADGRTTAEWLTERDLAEIAREHPADWNSRNDGPLPCFGGE